MLEEEPFDPDEILIDIDVAHYNGQNLDDDREVNFDTLRDENENFKDIADDLINTDDSMHLKIDY